MKDRSYLQVRLDENLRMHSAENSRPYELRVSIGVGRYEPRSSRTIDEIVDRADELMYLQKKAKKAS